MNRYRVTVDPKDGSFDPRRDAEIVTAATPKQALSVVRSLAWVRRFPRAELKVVESAPLEAK